GSGAGGERGVGSGAGGERPAAVGRAGVRTGPSPRGRDPLEQAAAEPDLAAALDDRARLRQLFEALRGRLNARECEAASLCYLQGLTRAQAAQRMGISAARMGKLMEGAGPGRPGVAGKVGQLLEAIRGGEWCEQQSSLMRGFAFGILDPRGERYRLARLHQRECPACRAYILSLRGLAAVLPPLPLPWGLGLEVPHAPSTPHISPTRHAPHASHPPGNLHVPLTRHAPHTSRPPGNLHVPPTQAAGAKAGTSASAGMGAGAGTGALSASGAAGGGWLLSGSLGAKLAVSCVLALSVGCVALTVAPHHAGASHRPRLHRAALTRSAYVADTAQLATGTTPLGGVLSGRSSWTPVPRVSRTATVAAVRRASTRHAQREFGPEQLATASGSTATTASAASVTARAASLRSQNKTAAEEPSTPASAAPPTHAEREFGPE
ncbi:MAG TPA: hypothetical protein VNY52_12485, partial [Solirubrobacteraceae bacterium]|nr:hypothetical protein [Solirubrobacteraceae bacterium]